MSARHALCPRPSILPLTSTLKSSSSSSIFRPPLPTHRHQTPPHHPRRALHARILPPPTPPPTPFVPDVPTFLTLIGRSLNQHASKFPSWDSLFTLSSAQLRDLGVEPPRARRYLLRWRDKFRHGEFGVGGDARLVGREDGRVEVRVVDVGIDVEDSVGRAREGRGGTMTGERPSATTTTTTTSSHTPFPSTGPSQPPITPARRLKATLNRDPGTERIAVNTPPHEVTLSPDATAQEVTETTGSDGAAGNAKVSRSDSTEAEAKGDSASNTRKVKSEPLSESEIAHATPLKGVRVQGAHGVRGSHVQVVAGTGGRVGVIRVREGMWEHRRGRKVDGGERRKAEVRAKRRATERRGGRG